MKPHKPLGDSSPVAESYTRKRRTRFHLSSAAFSRVVLMPGSYKPDRLRSTALVGVGRPGSAFAGILPAIASLIAGKYPGDRAWAALAAEWCCSMRLILVRELGLPAHSSKQLPAKSKDPSTSIVISVVTLRRIAKAAGVTRRELRACVEKGAKLSGKLLRTIHEAVSVLRNSPSGTPPSRYVVQSLRSLMSALNPNE